MMNVPERLTTVTHPHIASVYLKKDYSGHQSCEDVLVIETNLSHAKQDDEDFEMCLTELLGDLKELQMQAEQKIGHFDRVDIRTC